VTVPAIADFCVVNVVNDERMVQTWRRVRSSVRPALTKTHAPAPLEPSSENAVAQVIRTGKAMLSERSMIRCFRASRERTTTSCSCAVCACDR